MSSGSTRLVLAYALVAAGLSCGAIAVAALVDGNLVRAVIAGVPALALLCRGSLRRQPLLGRSVKRCSSLLRGLLGIAVSFAATAAIGHAFELTLAPALRVE